VSGAPGSGQLPLALRFPPDQRLDTFVATDPVVLPQLRALAVSAPAQCVLVAGGANTGKTHLAIAVCAEAGTQGIAAAYLPLASAAGRLRAALEAMEEHDLIALDGVEAIAGHRDDEVALFDSTTVLAMPARRCCTRHAIGPATCPWSCPTCVRACRTVCASRWGHWTMPAVGKCCSCARGVAACNSIRRRSTGCCGAWIATCPAWPPCSSASTTPRWPRNGG
jgi:hypothetical protein